jgi:hypothetical protein
VLKQEDADMRITKTLGRFSVFSNEQQWQVCLDLPKQSPKPHYIIETWSEEPEIEGLYPSELIDMYEDCLEKYLFPSDVKKKQLLIDWLKNNEESCDALWACHKKKLLLDEIVGLQTVIDDYLNEMDSKESLTEMEVTTLETIQQKD